MDLDIAVVILNWNGQEILPRFLPSVCEHSAGSQVYLIDNASSDDSVSWVREHFPQVTIIELSENYGFAGGYNEGLRQVEEPVYALINSDLEVTKDWLIPFREYLASHPDVAVLQPKVLDYTRRERFEYAGAAGGFMDMLAYPYCRGRIFQSIEEDEGQYNIPSPVQWATGACMVIRRSVFWSVGGFDTDYFAHQEEIDLCWRIRNQGHGIYYLGKSRVFHLGGATLEHTNPRKTFLNFRNSLFNLLKNAPALSLLYIIPLRLLLDGIAGVYFLVQNKPEHTWAVIRSHLSFYRNFRKMLRKRVRPFEKKYYHSKSIVYLHFVQGIRTFSSLGKD
jgi:hypothetical protein